MASSNFEKFKSDGSLAGNVLEWVDARFPLTANWKGHLSEYYAPKNPSICYNLRLKYNFSILPNCSLFSNTNAKHVPKQFAYK